MLAHFGRQCLARSYVKTCKSLNSRLLLASRQLSQTPSLLSDNVSGNNLEGATSSEDSSSPNATNLSRLRRALLYVPGNDQRKIEKVKTIVSSVDSIVLDCEDGVAVNMKEEARQKILATLTSLATKTEGYEDQNVLHDRLSVRINSIESGLAAEDLQVILSGPVLPKTLLLPKVDRKTDIDSFLESFQNALKARKLPESAEEGSKKQLKKAQEEQLQAIEPLDLIIYVESARGLLDLKEICSHFFDMAEFTKCRLAGIVFGSDDFCANIGATRSDDCHEVLLARQLVVLVAKAYELQAIDAVYINFKDLEGLKKQALEGASMGFTGKQAIHPTQASVIQDAFAPSDERVKWALGLVSAFEEAQAAGKGAFVYSGQMIDMPLLRQAFNVLRTAKQIGMA